MADYKAGNLTLEFFGIDRNVEVTITRVVNKLNLLQHAFDAFQKVNALSIGKNLSATFANIGKALGSINENDISKLSSLAKATNYIQRFLTVVQKSDSRQVYGKLSSLFRSISSSVKSIDQSTLSNITAVSSALSSLGRFSTKITKLDFAKTETGFKNLAVAIQPFLEKVKEAESGLSSLYGILQKTSGKKIQGLLDNKDKKRGGLFGLAKMGISIYSVRRLGRFMGDLVQAGSDYNETLNLWQVAMRNNLDVADQFVNKMQKAYGISSKTLMEAQAVFKNMIGSLGQISDATAYALSEALVQMSADYASLYNRTLESAFQNMQSMLAGQVRPIRSAGLDMTETTLYQYYQAIGGTKSMRQLNRTEKQLLSILAVYQQMGSAGALGDMTKTLNQYANQSRMLTEYWAELKTWSGLLLKDLVDQSGMLVHINALLITTTEIIKSIAKSRGIGDENFLTGMFESAELTNDEIDELQGKLLDFDKFRSLEGANASPLAIDEKLLQAITGYSSKIDQSQNAAQKLAETWLEFWINEETGGLTEDAERLLDTIEALGIVVGILVGYKLTAWIVKSAISLITLNNAMKLSTGLLLTGIVFAITRAIEAFKEGDKVVGWLSVAIGTALVGALIALKFSTMEVHLTWLSMIKGVFVGIMPHILGMVAGIGVLVAGIYSLSNAWGDMSGWHRALTIIGAVTAAIIGAVVAFKAFSLSLPVALGIGAALAGGVLLISSQFKTKSAEIPMHANGASDIDGGTLFVAGEMGKTEAVYTGSNGKTNVANIQQMKTAYNQALNEWWRSARNDIPAFQGVSDSGIYTIVDGEAKRRGKKFANV